MNYRILFISVFALFMFLAHTFPQENQKEVDQPPKENNTVVCIIGTHHTKTNFLNPDTLYNILCNIKPDLILLELDSSFFTKDFKLDTIKYEDILSTNETIAANRYQLKYDIDLRPFDITGRNVFYRKTNFFKEQKKMYNDISEFYDKGKLSKRNQEDFELLLFTYNLTNNIKYNSLQEFNSDVSIKLTELRQKILYEKTIEIVQSTDSLSQWIDFAKLQKNFWDKRNTTMVNNILKFVNEYKNKKIVVFVGFNHKYYLIKKLKESISKYNFKIKEFWEF